MHALLPPLSVLLGLPPHWRKTLTRPHAELRAEREIYGLTTHRITEDINWQLSYYQLISARSSDPFFIGLWLYGHHAH